MEGAERPARRSVGTLCRAFASTLGGPPASEGRQSLLSGSRVIGHAAASAARISSRAVSTFWLMFDASGFGS